MYICLLLSVTLTLSACIQDLKPVPPEIILPDVKVPETTYQDTATPAPTNTEPAISEATIPEATIPETTIPEHSDLYIPGIPVEDVITWFNEVALDTEFSYGGDATLVQKWMTPISYRLDGNATEKDLEVLESFAAWLNTIEGFPGITLADEDNMANLRIHFGDSQMILDILGDDYVNVDGGVRYWYEANAIYDAAICYRDDISQYTRNSVILEEIYNGLGLVQDTALREDSLIWRDYSEPQWLSEVDELLLKILYHPDIKCGMNAAQCEAVIRDIYY